MIDKLPQCRASGRDSWGYETYCSRPVTRVARAGWRCNRHSKPTDPAIKPQRIIEWQAQEQLREASSALHGVRERLNQTIADEARARACTDQVWLEETSVSKVVLKATVTYTDARWEASTVWATVRLDSWHLEGPFGTSRGGAHSAAMAALWAWISEKEVRYNRDLAVRLRERIEDLAVYKLGDAEAAVKAAQEQLAKVKEAVA